MENTRARAILSMIIVLALVASIPAAAAQTYYYAPQQSTWWDSFVSFFSGMFSSGNQVTGAQTIELPLSLNKPVTASGYYIDPNLADPRALSPEKAVDGDALTQWNSGTSTDAWLDINLGSQFSLNRVTITVAMNPNSYAHYEILVSRDGIVYEPVTGAVFDGSLISGQTVAFNLGGVQASHVKIMGSSLSWVAFSDASVYGTPAAPVITSISQTSGPVTGGNTVTIYGANFQQGTRAFFGTMDALLAAAPTANQLIVSVPTGPATGGLVDVTVQNPDGQSATLRSAYTYQNTMPLSITSLSLLPSATVGVPYSYALTATGGTPPYTWSLIIMGTLPPGLTFSADGRITGTPAIQGLYPMPVQVMDAAGDTATSPLSISVNPAPATCGNGLLDSGEVCDQTAPNNGCSVTTATCAVDCSACSQTSAPAVTATLTTATAQTLDRTIDRAVCRLTPVGGSYDCELSTAGVIEPIRDIRVIQLTPNPLTQILFGWSHTTLQHVATASTRCTAILSGGSCSIETAQGTVVVQQPPEGQFTASAQAAQPTSGVTVQVSPSIVRQGEMLTVLITGQPGASYDLAVYDAGGRLLFTEPLPPTDQLGTISTTVQIPLTAESGPTARVSVREGTRDVASTTFSIDAQTAQCTAPGQACDANGRQGTCQPDPASTSGFICVAQANTCVEGASCTTATDCGGTGTCARSGTCSSDPTILCQDNTACPDSPPVACDPRLPGARCPDGSACPAEGVCRSTLGTCNLPPVGACRNCQQPPAAAAAPIIEVETFGGITGGLISYSSFIESGAPLNLWAKYFDGRGVLLNEKQWSIGSQSWKKTDRLPPETEKLAFGFGWGGKEYKQDVWLELAQDPYQFGSFGLNQYRVYDDATTEQFWLHTEPGESAVQDPIDGKWWLPYDASYESASTLHFSSNDPYVNEPEVSVYLRGSESSANGQDKQQTTTAQAPSLTKDPYMFDMAWSTVPADFVRLKAFFVNEQTDLRGVFIAQHLCRLDVNKDLVVSAARCTDEQVDLDADGQTDNIVILPGVMFKNAEVEFELEACKDVGGSAVDCETMTPPLRTIFP